MFTLNRVPSRSMDKTPYEISTRKSPKLSFLKIWGCEAYGKHSMSNKLHPKYGKYLVCILGKLKDNFSIIKKKTECLLPVMCIFGEIFSQKESVGASCKLKKLEKHLKNVSVTTDPP